MTNDRVTGEVERCDLLIRNAYVLTCDVARTAFAVGAVAVRGSQIVAVGADAQITGRFRAARTIDAEGGLVHPGLMDSHYHVSYHMVGKLVAEVDLSRDDPGPWVAQQYGAMLSALGDEEEYANAMLCGLDMLKCGVTSVMDPGFAFEPDAIAQASAALGFRASLADPWIMDMQGPQLTGIKHANMNHEAALGALGGQLWRNRDPDTRVRGHISVYGMGNDSDELCLAAKAAADEAGVTFNMHQSQSVDDAEFDDARYGCHPMVHYADIGLLGANCLFVHMNVLRDDEYDPVVESGMSLVWSPTNSWFYGTRTSFRNPMPTLSRRGTNITIGLDVSKAASFGDQIYSAYLLARDQGEYLSPEDLLQMHTLNGAKALGIADRLGSLEPGKRADIVIRSPNLPEVRPSHNLVRNHLLLAKSRSVDTVLVDGEVLVKGGRLTRSDEGPIYELAERAANTIRERAGLG